MAVVGLHNVSVHNSSLSRESHQSSLSRGCCDRDRPSTRASALLQMWRELEGEHVTSHTEERIGERPIQRRVNELDANFRSNCLSRGHGHGDIDSLVDANEVEDFTISPRGLQSEHDDSKSLSSGSIDFGEIERERVKEIFREWRKSGLRDNASNDSHLINCSGAQLIGGKQSKRVRVVREWLEKTIQHGGTCDGGREEQDAEISAQIEQVCGGLVVDHSETGSRRNIHRLCGRQALLDLLMRAERERKRELQNLLEQRPVSDFPHRNRIQSLLKGRFLRNKRFIQEERPSLAAGELGLLRQRHTVSGLREGFLSESDNFVRIPVGSSQSDTSSNNDSSGHRNEITRTNSLQEVVRNECCDHTEATNEGTGISISYTDDSESDVSECLNLQASAAEVGDSHGVLEDEDRLQQSFTIMFTDRRDVIGEDAFRNLWESNCHDQLEGIRVEDLSMPVGPVQLEERHVSVTESGDIGWAQLGNSGYTERGDGSGGGTEMNSHDSSHQQYQVITDIGDGEHSRLQEPHEEWHDNDLIVATNNWSDEPSGQEVAPAERIDTSYFSDDDNEHSLEIRELLSRRRVSNLLGSDFRESLNLLIQSYVERQGNASVDWEQEHYQEQESGDLHGDESDVIRSTPVVHPSPQVTRSPTTWDQDFHDANWQQPNSQQHFGIEWELINDLRIDMARLHLRMNSMQTMLEACIDMQLELQRSVWQEISAALNRPSGSEEAREDNFQWDESKWDHVKKGICCMCCDTSIDSLLYRCGHMCTCSKCADKLVQGRDKCPMCQAPVVQVVRAYYIQ